MGGAKYNRLLGNRYVNKYKNSMKSLTKLKIPKLEDSIQRYLNALKPLLNENDWKKTQDIAKDFEKNEGAVLDREVRELDNKSRDSNYISEPWFDMYLKAREPIVLNYNPFMAFVKDPNSAQMNQAIRTTNFLISSVRFMKSLRANQLKPEIFHLDPDKSDTVFFQRLMRLIPESISFYGAYMFNAYPLDMSQYYRLFNSTRIPKKGKDVLQTVENKNHILIIHRGNFFVFPVLDANGKIFEPEEFLAFVQHILSQDSKEPEFPIGVLTTENRDTWADLRARLDSLGNQSALDAIDTALYCIALDDIESNSEDELSANFLHGDSKNRWFDKNQTLIVTKNGNAAINFEHSWGDGVAVLRFFNEIFEDSSKNAFVKSSSKPRFDRGDINKVVQKLDFKLDDGLKAAIRTAQDKYKQMTSRLEIRNFESHKYGRSFVKKFKLSPDSIMQAGIQVAYYKIYGKFVATYESASTSAFKYGRTETVRPATLATKRLAEYLAKKSDSYDSNEVLELLKECTKIHNQLVKEGAMGQGFDRHLFALKYHAENRKKQPTPEFFKSDSYKFINNNILSTSTLAYPTIMTGGFAPVVPDGFGIGYRILEKSHGSSVSSYSSSELKKFISTLNETYERFYDILKKSKHD